MWSSIPERKSAMLCHGQERQGLHTHALEAEVSRHKPKPTAPTPMPYAIAFAQNGIELGTRLLKRLHATNAKPPRPEEHIHAPW